jgi:hypothetical protein
MRPITTVLGRSSRELLTTSRIMAGKRRARFARRPLTFVEPKSASPADFSDAESQRVLTLAARAVARELGRGAAREYFAQLIGTPKAS